MKDGLRALRRRERDTLVAVTTAVAAAGLGLGVRQVLKWAWTRRTGTPPPNNPADRSVRWREALAWAALTGAAVGAGRVVGRRWASGAWEKARR